LIDVIKALHRSGRVFRGWNGIALFRVEVKIYNPKALLYGVLILFNDDLPTEDQPTGLSVFIPGKPALFLGFLLSVFHVEAERFTSITLFGAGLRLR